MNVKQLAEAAYTAWEKLNKCQTLDYDVRLEMCHILNCDPHQLENALTDDIIIEILCG